MIWRISSGFTLFSPNLHDSLLLLNLWWACWEMHRLWSVPYIKLFIDICGANPLQLNLMYSDSFAPSWYNSKLLSARIHEQILKQFYGTGFLHEETNSSKCHISWVIISGDPQSEKHRIVHIFSRLRQYSFSEVSRNNPIRLVIWRRLSASSKYQRYSDHLLVSFCQVRSMTGP